MSSLADLPELVGFFSYSREDDDDFAGTLSALRDGINRELRAQLGRSKRNFRLWQDQAAIAPGKQWESEIKAAVARSVFFIPIITPRAVNSRYCKFEFEAFLARENALGRSDLIFPVLYISVAALEDEALWRDDPVLSTIGRRQYVDWRPLRHLDIHTTRVRENIERLSQKIVETLNEPWEPPEERRRIKEATARQAEDEARRLEKLARQRAERKVRQRQAETKAWRGSEEDRSRRESEAERRADEEDRRTRAEAEAQRQTEEGRGRSIAFVEAPEPEHAAQARTEPVQIFISYRQLDDESPPDSPNDSGFVSYLLKQLRYDLTQMGVPEVNRWQGRAKLEPRDVWSDALSSALNKAELFIVILSTNYVTTPWCNLELSTIASRVEMLGARNGQRRIFRVDKHKVPEHDIPEMLRRIQAVRFYSEDHETNGVDEYFWRGKVRRPCEYEDAVHELALAVGKRLVELRIPRQP
jgi:hypothetical protein